MYIHFKGLCALYHVAVIFAIVEHFLRELTVLPVKDDDLVTVLDRRATSNELSASSRRMFA